ncbi:MAG: hypothetical protein AB1568_00540 [Thermodesulfobacteriota bacterium]
MKIDFDSRLLDISFEIYALEDHLLLIEEQMENMRNTENNKLKKLIKNDDLTPDDPEWHFANQEFNHRFEFLLPRVFRGPFIVTLYAIYEIAVTEIARLIQTTKCKSTSFSEFKGKNFLDRSKKYYKSILQFELCSDNKEWERIIMLAELRHALAHANGRLEMLKVGNRKNIKRMTKQAIGIEEFNGYLVFSAEFTKETFCMVRLSLEELIRRYKEWDSEQKTSQP